MAVARTNSTLHSAASEITGTAIVSDGGEVLRGASVLNGVGVAFSPEDVATVADVVCVIPIEDEDCVWLEVTAGRHLIDFPGTIVYALAEKRTSALRMTGNGARKSQLTRGE